MENISLSGTDVEELDLPQGFRFHPTDEELITQYLSKKVHDSCFCAKGIGKIELNKCEPWELPWIGTMVGKESYFFFLRDKKFRNGSKTNRSTPAGYWKATGQEKEIRKAKALIGIKKTLVFYKGRTSYGEKTSWIMHEYRLEGILSKDNLPETANTDWTVGRFFQKNIVRRKNHISGMLKLSSVVKDPPSLLLPLMDSSPCVTFFSGPTQTENWKPETPIFFASSSSNPPDISIAAWNFPIATPIYHSTQIGNPQYPDRFLVREHPMKRKLIENHGPSTKQNQTAEFSRGKKFDADVSTVIYNSGMVHTSFHNREYSLASPVLLDIGCLWTY